MENRIKRKKKADGKPPAFLFVHLLGFFGSCIALGGKKVLGLFDDFDIDYNQYQSLRGKKTPDNKVIKIDPKKYQSLRGKKTLNANSYYRLHVRINPLEVRKHESYRDRMWFLAQSINPLEVRKHNKILCTLTIPRPDMVCQEEIAGIFDGFLSSRTRDHPKKPRNRAQIPLRFQRLTKKTEWKLF